MTTDLSMTSSQPVAAGPAEFGHSLLKDFLFDPEYRNLNHGSFGSIPRVIQQRLRHYQDETEARPDVFIRYDYVRLLDESRAAIAKLLNAPLNTVVFVPNATLAANTVLRNLTWGAEDGTTDEILSFQTVYGACGKTIDYIVDRYGPKVASREIPLQYPCEDEDILAAFHAAVKASKAAGRRPRICIFDTISSVPGLLFPTALLTRACRELDILSLIDGAHGVGQLALNLEELDPDFFFSNCHKWLHVPRACAVLYIPVRNQKLIPSSIPTSHGYVSQTLAPEKMRSNPLPPSDKSKSDFVMNFEFVGTIDNAPYLCVKDAIRWRQEVLGGEERILKYLHWLAREGGRKTAEVLGTEVLQNKAGTLTDCALVNVALPLHLGSSGEVASRRRGNQSFDWAANSIPTTDEAAVLQWMFETLIRDYKTYLVLFKYGDRLWARLSSQVYLEMEDFAWAGSTLEKACKRAAMGEYRVRENGKAKL